MHALYIDIQGFSNHWTRRYSPVRTVRRSFLVMTFEKYACIDCIDLIQVNVIDVTDETVQQEVEMFPTCGASMVVVVDSNAINVSDIRLHFLHYFKTFLFRYQRNGSTMAADLQNVQEVRGELLESATGLKMGGVSCF